MSWDNMVGSKELLIVKSRGEEKPSTSVSFVVHRKLWAKVNGTHGYSFLLSVCVFIRAMHAHVSSCTDHVFIRQISVTDRR